MRLSRRAVRDELGKIQRQEHRADPKRIFADAFAAYGGGKRRTTTQWAIDERYFPTSDGGKIRYDIDMTPYLREPQDKLDEPSIDVILLSANAQSGKSTVAENWLGASMQDGPRDNFIWYCADKDSAKTYAEQKLTDFWSLHEDIAKLIGKRATDNKIQYKRFGSNWFEIAGATAKTVVSRTARRIFVDEFDLLKASLQAAIAQIRQRLRTKGKKGQIVVASHPDQGEEGGIFVEYLKSDQCLWFWKCRHCGEISCPSPHVVSLHGKQYYMQFKFDDDKSLKLPQRIKLAMETAHAVCPHNDCVVTQEDRYAMNLTGRWIGMGQKPGELGQVEGERIKTPVIGYMIDGLMSPFLDWADAAKENVEAQFEYDERGNPGEMRTWEAKTMGRAPSVSKGGQRPLAVTFLKDNHIDQGYRMGEVPRGPRFTVTAVDCQADKFVISTRGYDLNAQSWLIDRFEISQIGTKPVRPAEDDAAWEHLSTLLLNKVYPLQWDKSRGYMSGCIVVDIGGKAKDKETNTTAMAREHARRLYARGVPKWKWVLIKGSASKTGPLVQPRTDDRDRDGKRLPDFVPFNSLNVHELKIVVTRRNRQLIPGPSKQHFPRDTPDNVFDEICSERLIKGSWEPIRTRNEQLDLDVYCEAGRLMLRPEHEDNDWDNDPPIWAAIYDMDGNQIWHGKKADIMNENTPAPVAAPRSGSVLERMRNLNR